MHDLLIVEVRDLRGAEVRGDEELALGLLRGIQLHRHVLCSPNLTIS